jgi:hypothetical protein
MIGLSSELYDYVVEFKNPCFLTQLHLVAIVAALANLLPAVPTIPARR